MAHSFTPRPSQQNILRYTGGRLGIAAVPGAGKTHILSALAAKIIHEGQLQDGQELLIVTLVNSAVDNFRTRIESFFDNKISALYKYRVRTLHGLAHDIVREKPARVGLEERFGIIDEREAGFIRREAVNAWLASHSLDDYLDPALDQSKRIGCAVTNFPTCWMDSPGIHPFFKRPPPDSRKAESQTRRFFLAAATRRTRLEHLRGLSTRARLSRRSGL
jgi:superfamily I DNA/RNA helicase